MTPPIDAAAIAREKRVVALSSVGAGIGLTALKIVIGVATGSLGILAEAAHSGLDLVAALMTLLAVRVSDLPADASHPYGHGKVENLSAFLEAGLLLITAAWVGYEAIRRLSGLAVHVDASAWAFVVMGVSILIDVTRSRALRRVAKKAHSQAIEADALHFSTDIWSSAVVIGGLVAVRIGDWTHWPGPWEQADAVAALGVCAVVMFVGSRLAKETIDALLDRAPQDVVEQIARVTRAVPGVVSCQSPRVRRVGAKVFVDMVVQIPRTSTFSAAHATTEAVEEAVRRTLPDADVDLVLHMEPVAAPDESAGDTIRYLAREAGLRVHDVYVTQTTDETARPGERIKLDADVHVEVDPSLTLAGTHALADQLEIAARQAVPSLRRVNTHLEVLAPEVEHRREVTAQQQGIVQEVCRVADSLAGPSACHEVHVYRPLADSGQTNTDAPGSYDLVIHLTFPGQLAIPEVHEQSEQIERALRAELPQLAHVLIHAEPEGVR